MALSLEFVVNDKATPEIKKLQEQLKQLKPHIDNADTGFKNFNSSLVGNIAQVAGAVIAFRGLTSAMSGVVSNGFAYNKSLEESKAGLIALSVAVQDKAIPATERFARANLEASSTLKELQKINSQTPHSLDQTNQIYKAMYVSMSNAGASTKDMIELTRSISIASGAAGIEFNSLLAGVDGLATGTVLANSDLGRFLSSLGLTNETLKESKDVVGLLTNKLKDFKAMNTMAEATSNFRNEWDSLTASMTTDVFDGVKDGLNELALSFRSMSQSDIKNLRHGINEFGVISLNVAYGTASAFVELTNAFDSLGARIAGVAFRISEGLILTDEENAALEKMYQETKNNIAARDAFVESLKKARDIAISSIESNERQTDSLSKNNDITREINISKSVSTELTQKEIDALVAENDARNAAIEALEKYNDSLVSTYEKYIAITGSEYDKWLVDTNKTLVDLAESGALTAQELQNVFDVLEAQRDTEITIGNVEESLSGMEDILEAQITLTESGMNWSDSLDGVAGSFSDIGKAIKKLDLNKLKFEKADIKLQKDYAKAFLKANGDMAKEKELEAKFDADQAQLTKTRQMAEIGGYAALAGAISQAFAEGSSAAKAFQGIQATLGIVNSLTAISGAWASAPFPANMPAVAATMAQMIPLIGQLTSLGGSGGGGGGGSAAPVISGTFRNDDYYDNALDIAEQSNKPILDKFDRQIALLEEISGYGGVSATASLNKALAEYTAQTRIDIINAAQEGGGMIGSFSGATDKTSLYLASVANASYQIVQKTEEQYRKFIAGFYGTFGRGIDAGQTTFGYGVTILEEAFGGASDFIDFLEYLKSNNLLSTFGYTELEYENILNDFQNATNEFVTSLISDINSLTDFSQDLKDAFDKITGTTKYEDIALSNAFEDVYALIGDRSLTSYIEEQIRNIDSLANTLSDEDIALLLSSNIDDFTAQQELIARIQSDALETLDAGAIEALNFQDQIMLVADALAQSAEDAKDFRDALVGMVEDIDKTIYSIRTKGLSETELTNEEIKRLNLTQRAFEVSLAGNDTEKAQELLDEITSLSTSISNSAFGDTSLLDRNLIANLEATKAMIDFEDTIIKVHIVDSDLTEPVMYTPSTPSVTVANPTNDSERLDNIEAIMTQLLINNRNMYDVLLRIENGGLPPYVD